MPDIREQLRRIEISAPPDLWKEIEMRATKNRPEIEPSVIAFRPRGAQVRRRVAAGLLAAAVFAVTAVVVWEASRSAVVPRPKPPQSGIPEGWEKCTNTTRGYSIAYPGDWHTTDVFDGTPDPANACQWFSPDPFGPQGNVIPEGWAYPLELVFRGSSFDQVLEERRDPELADVLLEEELFVNGHRAVRLEKETLIDLIADTGLHYEYVIEVDPETTLIVHTTATRGVAGVYADNKVVVDRAVDTLQFLADS